VTTTQTVVMVPEPWRVPLSEAPACMVTRAAAADWCYDHDEDVIGDALRWTLEKRRSPYPSDLVKGQWYWIGPQGRPPEELFMLMPSATDLWFYGCGCWDRLLVGWAAGTEAERRSWWAWTPGV
jgi:hypothetical protein